MLTRDPGDLFRTIDFSGRACVIAAVSGGGDSLALLFLLQDYLKLHADAPRLQAVTVDHRLRPEAAEEAAEVERLCRRSGIAHRTMRWRGAKPATGVSEAARRARLDLLAQAAKDAGTDLVFTGHTADDQAETLAMRSARGHGRGLAGIAPASLYDNRVWFLRPLLTERRAALRVFLQERGITWIEDPTNRDRRFERVRLRQSLSENEIARLVEQAEEEAALRETAGRGAAALISRSAEQVAPGLFRLHADDLRNVAGDEALYAFRILLAVAGGTPHLPRESRSRDVLSRAMNDSGRATLSRAVISRRGRHIYFHRENRNLPEARLDKESIWDGRYRIAPPDEVGALRIVPFGTANAHAGEIGDFDAPAGLVRAALAAQPAVRAGDEWTRLAADILSLRPVAGPWSHLLPCFDLAPAEAVRTLIGGETIPILPLNDHRKLMT